MILLNCLILLFDCLLDCGNPESFFPNEKNTAMFQFMLLGVVLGKKSSNDSRLTVITLNVVRHVPRASGPFLRELPAKASGVEV